MAEPRTFTVSEDDDGIRLDRWAKRNLPDVTFNMLSRWSRLGQVKLDDAAAAPGDRIAVGQRITLPPAEPEAPASTRPKQARPKLSGEERDAIRAMVIYEDADAFVLAKPPGLATQGGTKTTTHVDRLLDGLANEGGQRPKLVHRLDKDTSGALLVARTARSAGHFAKAFSGRTARKVYWAIVVGVPSAPGGTIDLPLAKQPGTGGEKMHVDEEHGLPAKTRWRMLDRAGNSAAWIELEPLTGRTHQLRAHMASLGHPIVGDAKYGGAEAFLTGGVSRKLHLHARRLRIDSIGGRKIDVTAELPAHFAESLAMLGFDLAAQTTAAATANSPAPKLESRRVAQQARARRRARRGERRARGQRSSRGR